VRRARPLPPTKPKLSAAKSVRGRRIISCSRRAASIRLALDPPSLPGRPIAGDIPLPPLGFDWVESPTDRLASTTTVPSPELEFLTPQIRVRIQGPLPTPPGSLFAIIGPLTVKPNPPSLSTPSRASMAIATKPPPGVGADERISPAFRPS